MIRMTPGIENQEVYVWADGVTGSTKHAIRRSFAFAGKQFVKDSRTKMKTTERDLSKTYYVRIRGRIVAHNPSKEYYPAAIMTGELSKSVRYLVNGSDSMKFGAGYTDKVTYAGFVELGTRKMKERSYLRPAIFENDRNVYATLGQYIKDDLDE